MSSTTSNCLNYKELQAALKVYKNDGLTTVKLNAKADVLQAEYDRLTTERPPHLITSEYNAPPIQAKLAEPLYPFCSNTVAVLNSPTLPTLRQEQELATRDVITRTLPAMNKKYAPSWLCKPVTVYVVDGIDYLPCELDMALKGDVCELTCEVPEKAEQEPASPYFIDTSKAARYLNGVKEFSKGLGTTELQCARNVEDAVRGAIRGLAAVISIAKGFHARQVERALKVA